MDANDEFQSFANARLQFVSWPIQTPSGAVASSGCAFTGTWMKHKRCRLTGNWWLEARQRFYSDHNNKNTVDASAMYNFILIPSVRKPREASANANFILVSSVWQPCETVEQNMAAHITQQQQFFE